MLKVRISRLNTWMREHNIQNKYCVKILDDPLFGMSIGLYEIYTNGTKSLIKKSSDIDEIKDYLIMRIK